MDRSIIYPGKELELFQHAINWKRYFSSQIKPYISGKVLEVGAGIGANTTLLNDGSYTEWLMIEPDEKMNSILKGKLASNNFPKNCRLSSGTIDHLSQQFDTIIYIDVLEHIEDDISEINKAASLLNVGGHLIILSPAFPFLYSQFDKEIGHYRRYSKAMVKKLTPKGMQLISNRYYDSAGYFASLLNKLILQQKYPTRKQIKFWDKWLIPLSILNDKILFHSIGKSIIGVWKKIN